MASAKSKKPAVAGNLRVERGANLAARIGTKRKGALIRSLLIDPESYSVAQALGEASHPLVEMGIGNGGSGGEIRLKLWLTLMAQFDSTNPWVDLGRFSAPLLARVFGLDEDPEKGAEAVRRAYRWLISENFVVLDGTRLKPSGRVRVTTEAALFLPDTYREVVRVVPAGKAEEPPYPEFPRYKDSYFRVPIALWSQGWMGYLRSSELMVLMILCKLNENKGDKEIEVRAKTRLQRFGLSDVMWRQGATGLERRGILRSWDPARTDIDQITAEKINYRMVFRFNGASVEDALSRPIKHDLHVKIREDLT